MKKFTLLFMAAMLMGFFANAQVIFSDDFEGFTDGDYVADNSTEWTTWSDAPGTAEDAVISTTYANSGSNSMFISGTNDMGLPLGDLTTGKYYSAFQIYVETGSSGYYNIQHEWLDIWAFECYFNEGTGHLEAGGESIEFSYDNDAWVAVEHYIDLDNDLISLYIGGEYVYQWPFSHTATGTGTTNALAAYNFYNGGETGTAEYYVDDVIFEEFDAVFQEVTFNVDMTVPLADGAFDPAADTLIVAGSMNGWAGPGTDNTMFMADEDEDSIYTVTRMLLPGDYEYKYFINSGWGGGEWEGGDNRAFTLAEETLVLDDIWGDPTNFIAPVETIQFSVYPNPTSGIVNITADQNAEVTVSNTVGQIIMHKVLGNSGTINLTNETTGVYFVTVRTNQGTATQRVIVE